MKIVSFLIAAVLFSASASAMPACKTKKNMSSIKLAQAGQTYCCCPNIGGRGMSCKYTYFCSC